MPVQSFKSDAAVTLNGKAIATGAASMQSTPAAMAGAELLTFSKSQPDATGPMTPALPWVDAARPRANARCSVGAQRLSIEAKRLKNVAPPTATLQGSGVRSDTSNNSQAPHCLPCVHIEKGDRVVPMNIWVSTAL